MQVTLNGKILDVAGSETVAGLLLERGLSPDKVVVEINGEIISPEDYEPRKLAGGDKIEIMSFVGGG